MSLVACIEVGGSSVETVTFTSDGHHARRQGVVIPSGHAALVAAPGLVQANRVLAASNLGWFDVDPLRALGIDHTADLVLNDAEAAALGEVALRHDRDVHDAVFVGLGTGVGGAVILDDTTAAENLFGHRTGYSDRGCPCGAVGCLETIAAGWALPTPLGGDHIEVLARGVADAIEAEERATPRLVVVAGGIARRYPQVVEDIAALLPSRIVEPSLAPADTKSAAAWGLRLAHDLRVRVADAV